MKGVDFFSQMNNEQKVQALALRGDYLGFLRIEFLYPNGIIAV